MFRRNSQLAYPPAMEKALLDLLEDRKDVLRRRYDLEDAKRQQNKPIKPRLLATSLPLDLTGVPDHYPKQKMLAVMPSVPVEIHMAQSSSPGGTWTPRPKNARKIKVYVTGDLGSRGQIAQLRGTLRHELRHMMQTIMGDALGLKGLDQGGGIPRGGWVEAASRLQADYDRVNNARQKLGRRAPQRGALDAQANMLKAKYGAAYYLDPVEYFTHLGNARDALLGGRRSGGEALFGDPEAGLISDARFEQVTGLREPADLSRLSYSAPYIFIQGDTYPLLFWLKRYAPDDLYRKAVGDLRAWASAHNEIVKRSERAGRALTTSRILSDLLTRFDREDPMLAAELRLNRLQYEAMARALVES